MLQPCTPQPELCMSCEMDSRDQRVGFRESTRKRMAESSEHTTGAAEESVPQLGSFVEEAQATMSARCCYHMHAYSAHHPIGQQVYRQDVVV